MDAKTLSALKGAAIQGHAIADVKVAVANHQVWQETIRNMSSLDNVTAVADTAADPTSNVEIRPVAL